MLKHLEISDIKLLGIVENGDRGNIGWWGRTDSGLMEAETEENTEAFEPHSPTQEEEMLWGECVGSMEHCIRTHGGLMWTCSCVISVYSRNSVFFYIWNLEWYYMILCVYQSLPKLLDCEVKNQVKHMCSFKNHIHKNAS